MFSSTSIPTNLAGLRQLQGGERMGYSMFLSCSMCLRKPRGRGLRKPEKEEALYFWHVTVSRAEPK